MTFQLNLPKTTPVCPPSLEIFADHFGFLPTQFVDDVINGVNDLVAQAMSELERVIELQLGASPDTEKVPFSPL
jgi:hypothetical protein